jgi:DNA invertase Pin-like site-specific DNA recombinase
MLVGFARLSEHEPPADLDAQRRLLAAWGCEKTFTSGSTLRGAQAARDRDGCLRFLRESDTLVISRPDRLARGPAELIKIADALSRRNISLVVLTGFGAPLSSHDRASMPTWGVLRYVAAWVRSERLELQKTGIKRARQADPSMYTTGRPRISASGQAAIMALAFGDGLAPSAIAHILRIGRSTVYRYLPKDYSAPRLPKRTPRERIDAKTVQVLLASGVGPTRIAASLGCSRSSVRRLSV